MKASELMIGDWVENPRCTKVFQIVGMEIMPKGDACRLKNDEYNCDTWCDRIKPIPLTEDILKANGWKITKGNPSQGTMTRGFFQNIGFVYFFDDGIEFEIGIHTRVRGIMGYVHELQHAFRLCSLNELADSFKVE